MEYLSEWLILITVFGMAVMAPGPDFVIAIRNSIVHSRRAGIFTAIGFGLGVMVHVAYSIVGIATIISQSIVLFNIIKMVGAAYLIFIGFKALMSKGQAPHINGNLENQKPKKQMGAWTALGSGFVTNLFNPKATLFFLALFTQILDPGMPLTVKAMFGLTCVFMTAGWFSIVAVVLTNKSFQARFLRFTKWIDRVCGGLMIALGVKLALTR